MILYYQKSKMHLPYLLFFFRKMTNSKIDFTVESNFKNEISILEKEGAVLLGAIQVLQDYLDYKKQNAAVVDPSDLNDLNELKQMIIKFLHILSLIDVYQYFDSKNETISDAKSFLLMVDYDYSVRMNKFWNDLKSQKKMIFYFYF